MPPKPATLEKVNFRAEWMNLIAMKWLIFTAMLIFGLLLLGILDLLDDSRQGPSTAAWLAFQSDRTGNHNIYRIQADGTNLEPLTGDIPVEHWFPNWSPDGNWILFESDRNHPTNFDQYRMSPDGRMIQRLTTTAQLDCCGSWSPDMTQIAFHSARDGVTTQQTQVNGGNREIYIMDVDGSNQYRITDYVGWDCCASWSPSGDWIAFQSDRGNAGRSLFVMRPDGSDVRLLARQSSQDPISRWSPDGEWILFTGDFNGFGDVYRIRPDGTDLEPLTTDPAYDCCASWSPDGNWIAFASERLGNRDIYLMRPDGSELTRLTNHPAIDHYPTWSPVADDPFRRRYLAIYAGFALVFAVLLRIGTGIYSARRFVKYEELMQSSQVKYFIGK